MVSVETSSIVYGSVHVHVLAACAHTWLCYTYVLYQPVLGEGANTSTYWAREGPISLSPHTHTHTLI